MKSESPLSSLKDVNTHFHLQPTPAITRKQNSVINVRVNICPKIIIACPLSLQCRPAAERTQQLQPPEERERAHDGRRHHAPGGAGQLARHPPARLRPQQGLDHGDIRLPQARAIDNRKRSSQRDKKQPSR